MIDDGAPKTISEFPMAENDLRIALEAHDLGMLRSLQICFPACVYSYDRNTHTAEVMPLVKQAFFNGTWVYLRRKPIKVTVRNIQCGGFTVDYPLYIGDTGWVISSDRDTMLLKQKGALTNSVLAKNRTMAIVEDDYQQVPNQPILHDFTRGFFIPDNWGSWENHRYKDNPGVAVGTSLYIGSSIDTNDDRPDVDKKKYQNGTEYEKKVTSSIVMQSGGGLVLASSAEKKAFQTAHVEINRNKVEMRAKDHKQAYESAMCVDAAQGLLIKQDIDGKQKHFICSIQPGMLNFRLMDEKKMLSVQFIDGTLHMSTSGDVNVKVDGGVDFRCNGNVNIANEGDMNIHSKGDTYVNTEKDASVTARSARVVAQEEASVTAKTVSAGAAETININSGGIANIGAVTTTNINAGETINLAAGKTINVTAPESVDIVTASDIVVMAKKVGANILLTTLSKDSNISIVTEGENSYIDVTTEGKDSSISLNATQDVMVSAEGDVSLEAEGDVSINASGEVSVEGSKSVYVGSDGEITLSSTMINLIAGTINLQGGDVHVTSKMDLNGKEFVPRILGACAHGGHDQKNNWEW